MSSYACGQFLKPHTHTPNLPIYPLPIHFLLRFYASQNSKLVVSNSSQRPWRKRSGTLGNRVETSAQHYKVRLYADRAASVTQLAGALASTMCPTAKLTFDQLKRTEKKREGSLPLRTPKPMRNSRHSWEIHRCTQTACLLESLHAVGAGCRLLRNLHHQ